MSPEYWSHSSTPHCHSSGAPPPPGPHPHAQFSHPHFSNSNNNPCSWHHSHTRHRSGKGPNDKLLFFLLGAGAATLWMRRGHKLLFFALGAGVATLWMKHKKQLDRDACYAEYCGGYDESGRWRAGPSYAADNDVTLPSRQAETKAVWDQERKEGKNAQPASDMAENTSESSLDTVLSALTILKLQLEEECAQRRDKQSVHAAERVDVHGSHALV